MKLYLSAPAYNEAQVKGYGMLHEAAEAAGFEVLDPNQLDTNKAVSEEMALKAYQDERRKLLDEADMVLAWLDQLMLPGHQYYMLYNIQQSVDIPLPPQMVRYLSAGMMAFGHAKMAPKRGIIDPRDPLKGQEVTNCPTAIKVGPEGGIIANVVPPGPLNFPDTNVVYEVGYARARGIPIVGLGIAYPRCGLMVPLAMDALLLDVEEVAPALKEIKSVMGDEDAYKKTLTDIKERVRKKAEARLRKLKELADKEREKAKEAEAAGAPPSNIIVPDLGR